MFNRKRQELSTQIDRAYINFNNEREKYLNSPGYNISSLVMVSDLEKAIPNLEKQLYPYDLADWFIKSSLVALTGLALLTQTECSPLPKPAINNQATTLYNENISK